MSNALSWSKHLLVKRGFNIVNQTLRMYKFHSTPFDDIMTRMFDLLDNYDSNFTFPLTASSGMNHPDMVDLLKSSGNEIAIHGYKHIRYDFVPVEQQEEDLVQAIKVFKELKIPYSGHRVPYNQYTQDTENLVEKYGFKWDGGIGYRKEHQNKNEMFRHMLSSGKMSSFTCIPLSIWSDDYMIDYLYYSPKKIAQKLIKSIMKAERRNGLVMFDLHPIRIGQRFYLTSVEATLDYCRKNDVWVPNVSEAVDYWNKHKKWKGDTKACCLLTGDIDNFTFWDYLRRF
jgi:peptidoglycan/xylan/chitin deacetylase (PgdA/CDA1 family)